MWVKGGNAGLLCPQVTEEYGGAGGDFRMNAVIVEEFALARSRSLSLSAGVRGVERALGWQPR